MEQRDEAFDPTGLASSADIQNARDAIVAAIQASTASVNAQLATLQTGLEAALEEVETAISTASASEVAAIQNARDQLLAAIASLEAAGTASGDDIVDAVQVAQAALEAALETVRAEVALQGDNVSDSVVALEATLTASTATLEASLTSIEATLQSEFDQTQVALESIRAAVAALPTPQTDIFGRSKVSIDANQVEVPYDDTNWATFVDQTSSGGAPAAAQAAGQVTVSSGTGANGSRTVISKDAVKYRLGQEVGWGGTWKLDAAGAADSFVRIGAFDDTSFTNGVFIGYEGTTFGITYRRGGATIWTRAPAAWLDPCDGTVGSSYTLNGSPVALDRTKDQLLRIRAGLFGHRGFIAEVLAPDGHWVKVLDHTNVNAEAVPVFTNNDLKVGMAVGKTGAGATNLSVTSACWAGWTASDKARISDTLSDRTLASRVVAALVGRTNAGSWVGVAVNSQGRLFVTNDSVGATGAAAPTSASLAGYQDGSGNLQPFPPPATSAKQDILNATVAALFDGTTYIHTPELDPDEVYVTPWYDVKNIASISGIITTDQYSAIGGLRGEWSDLGTEAAGDPPQYPPAQGQTAIPGVALPFLFSPTARYFRVRYTNGANAASPKGSITLRRVATENPAQALAATLTDLSMALVTLGVLAGKRDDGAYGRVGLTNLNSLKVAIMEAVALKLDATTAWDVTQEEVPTTPIQVDLGVSGRKTVAVKAMSDNEFRIFVGKDSTVSTTNGWELVPGESLPVDLASSLQIWLVAEAGTPAPRYCIIEVGDP